MKFTPTRISINLIIPYENRIIVKPITAAVAAFFARSIPSGFASPALVIMDNPAKISKKIIIIPATTNEP